jgi:hypothetical protein
MDAEEERRLEKIREENRRQDEAEDQRRRDQQEREAYLKGVETGDYTSWYPHIGRSPQELAQGTGTGSGSGPSSYEHPVRLCGRAVRTALNRAHRVPRTSRDKWLFDLELIKPERPQNALITVQGIIRQVTDMRDVLRPRRQGMDLDLSQRTARIEYDAQVRVILDQLQQLKAYLASMAS